MWLETVEISSGHTSPMHGTVEFLSPRIFPNRSQRRSKVLFLLFFPGLQQHSHYLNAEQHQNQVDLHRSLTSPSQIAATAAVSYCLLLEEFLSPRIFPIDGLESATLWILKKVEGYSLKIFFRI